MNRRFENFHSARELRRSRNGWFLGVCGGLAEYFGFRAWALRLVALIVSFMFFPIPLFIYGLLAVIMRPAPCLRHATRPLH